MTVLTTIFRQPLRDALYGPLDGPWGSGVDVTAPTITSANAINLVENTALSHTLTANEGVTWTKTGGADTGLFTLVGSTLSMAAKDFETPTDADTNNTYVVQVTATDAALNATIQTITVTVTDMEAESEALIARFSTPPTDQRKVLINNYVAALKTAGVWSKLDLFYVKAAADNQAAQRNWLADAFNLTEVNAPTFTADRGYTGNGSSMELTTGYAPSVNAVQLSQNSGHIGAFVLTTTGTGGFDFSAVTATTPLGVRVITTTGASVARVNATGNCLSIGTLAMPRHNIAIRRDASNVLMFSNGVQHNTVAAASAALTAASVSVLRGNNAWSDRQVAITHLGAALSDVEALAFYNASLAYLQGVGAA